MNNERHIDLHLPQGWNRCTTEELELIATSVIMNTRQQDRYHVFDMAKVKVEVFLAINGLEIVGGGGNGDDEEAVFAVRFTHSSRWERLKARIGRTSYDFDGNRSTGIFELPVGYVHAMIAQNLSWLDDEKASPLTTFPYPKMDVKEPRKGITLHRRTHTFTGPNALMDGYSWADYRYLQDWMQLYVMHSNSLQKLMESKVYNEDVRDKTVAHLTGAIDNARAGFLATLFKNEVLPADGREHPLLTDDERIALFLGFPAVQWQVILFWWSSLMKILARKFPHVFKERPVDKKARQQTPWDFYNRVTATLQKDGHLSEDDLNRETYSVTLQKLEMMAVEAEEMKKKQH